MGWHPRTTSEPTGHGRDGNSRLLARHMTNVTMIECIRGREVLDSRGHPTVEAEVHLSDGSWGSAIVPSGTSKGTHEAVEVRDGDQGRFKGWGVLTAVSNIHDKISPALRGHSPFDQAKVDSTLLQLDGTAEKSNLGANAVLAVSLATAHAAAAARGVPLYRYLSSVEIPRLPVPMFNILNGGKHALESTDIQEYMVVPVGAASFAEGLRAGTEIYHALGGLLKQRSLSSNVGDEGGFAPSLASNAAALEIVLAAIERAGYSPGKECFIALDVAASELYDGGSYRLEREGVTFTSRELVNLYSDWVMKYPILSIEDGLAEDDWEGWRLMTSELGGKVQLVGDDLYTTSANRINQGVQLGASNCVLIKPNQIGTLTETIDAMTTAKRARWGTVMSHRSGETEDTTIADLAVAWDARQIKAGAPCRSERLAKYNRLLRIEGELGDAARYAGLEAYGHIAVG